jgi:hypothetical protein
MSGDILSHSIRYHAERVASETSERQETLASADENTTSRTLKVLRLLVWLFI